MLEVDGFIIGVYNNKNVMVIFADEGCKCVVMSVPDYKYRSIDMALKNKKTASPSMYDIMIEMFGYTNTELEQVDISKLMGGYFYSDLVLSINGHKVKLICDPSDAISIAIRLKKKIFINEDILVRVEDKLEQIYYIKNKQWVRCGDGTFETYDNDTVETFEALNHHKRSLDISDLTPTDFK